MRWIDFVGYSRWAGVVLLALMLMGCTFIRTESWMVIDVHPLQDGKSFVLDQTPETVHAEITQMVRPESESATHGTLRAGLHYGALVLAGAGVVTGNWPLVGGASAVAEAVR